MKKVIIPILIVAALGAVIYFAIPSSTTTEQVNNLTTQAQKGEFIITITATGELQAKNSVKIQAPRGMRPAGIFRTTITNMVAEGTIIKKGDFVASLDRTELANKMSTVQNELDKIQTQLDQAKIDTAIELKDIRDQLINLEFTKTEKQLKLEESKFEPESVVKSAKLDMQRTERDYEQLKKRYKLKQQQSQAKVEEIKTLQRQNQMQMDRLAELSSEFNIMAPEEGMLIYTRTWRGKKEPGSEISAWDPIVAELPDLTDMISQTYVNEVDISKVMEGQQTNIKVDAFPDKAYTGKVIKVANIGEQLRGYDAKVFEVIVQVNEIDSILRPAMTTSIEIVTNTFEDVVHVPLEAIFSDSLSFVYKKQGARILKQEVITGLSNSTEIIIDYGLKAGEEVLLSEPLDKENIELLYIDPVKKEQVRKQQMEAEAERRFEAQRMKKSVENISKPKSSSNGGGGSFVIFD